MLLVVFVVILVIGIFLLYASASTLERFVLEILGFLCSLWGAAVSFGCTIAWTVFFFSADEAYKEDLARYESIISTLDKATTANITVKDMNPVILQRQLPPMMK